MESAPAREQLVVEAVRALEGLAARVAAAEAGVAELRREVREHALYVRQVAPELDSKIERLLSEAKRSQDRADREELRSDARWSTVAATTKSILGVPAVQTIIVIALAGWLGISLGALHLPAMTGP